MYIIEFVFVPNFTSTILVIVKSICQSLPLLSMFLFRDSPLQPTLSCSHSWPVKLSGQSHLKWTTQYFLFFSLYVSCCNHWTCTTLCTWGRSVSAEYDFCFEHLSTLPLGHDTDFVLGSEIKLGSLAQDANCDTKLTLTVLNFWKFTSYCSSKPLWSGMGEVVPARTSPTLHPPSPPTVHQLSRLAL